jgi:hypothetical protein
MSKPTTADQRTSSKKIVKRIDLPAQHSFLTKTGPWASSLAEHDMEPIHEVVLINFKVPTKNKLSKQMSMKTTYKKLKALKLFYKFLLHLWSGTCTARTLAWMHKRTS